MRFDTLLVTAALLVGGGPLYAQAERSEIVVQGERGSVDQEIKTFVKALTPSRVGGKLGRFDDRICPAAVGLPEQQNQAVAARMRRVAHAIGMAPARADCAPNAIVIVADNKVEFIAALRRQYPAYFQTSDDNLIPIPHQPGPATAWHIQTSRDSDGIQTTRMRFRNGSIVESSSSTSSGRIRPSTRPSFAAGILVVERKGLAGLTTTQLADYAAMRLYARTDPTKLGGLSTDSILTALDAPMGSPTPITLTQWDFAFLKAFYATDPLQYARQQRSDIERDIKRDRAGTADQRQ